MTTCERCGTQNLDGSRYCDACGAAMWLAGRVDDVAPKAPQSNGPDWRSNEVAAATVASPDGSANPSTITESRAPLNGDDGAKRAHATLVIERGNAAGKQFRLNDQEANIGRWDAEGGVFPDVDLDSCDPEAKVSRRHARISFQNGGYAIEDLGSTNGTFINRGHRLPPGSRHPLHDGDEIIVGKTFLRFRIVR